MDRNNVVRVKKEMSFLKATLSMFGGSVHDAMLDMVCSPPLFKCHVRVGPSPNKGKGVFVAKAVKAGEVITMYPCHILLKGGIGMCHKDNAKHMQRKVDKLHDYKFTFNPDLEIMGDPDAPFCPHMCGHMINDPHPDVASLRHPPSTPEQAWKMGIEYMIRTSPQTNCVLEGHDDFVVLCMATRDIAEGEEVFAQYGVFYWNKMPTNNFLALMNEHRAWLQQHKPHCLKAATQILQRCTQLLRQ